MQSGDAVRFTLTLINEYTKQVEPINTATALSIVVTNAAGTIRIPMTAAFSTDGTDGKLTARVAKDTIVTGDKATLWSVQGWITLPGDLPYRTKVSNFTVEPNL